MTSQEPPVDPPRIEIESLGGKVWDIVAKVAVNLDDDATQFGIALEHYVSSPMDIARLQDIKRATDGILEQREVIFPILEALSRYLDQHLNNSS